VGEIVNLFFEIFSNKIKINLVKLNLGDSP
jgi:hypothetical protein